MTTRMMVTLTNDEARALARMSYSDLRDPREQLRHLLREEARKRDLLPEQKNDRPVANAAT
jgi:hypothetical protein